MTGTRTRFSYLVRQFGVCVCVAAAVGANVRTARAVVKVFDGFGDADRNNDGQITFYDTDINDSGTWNDATLDAGLISRNITEVTAAQDATDVGIIWSGIRSYDTANNIPKSRLRIINDSVATGSEMSSEIHNHGLALGVESRGTGSSFIGRFPQSVAVGTNTGDKLVVSVDWRVWRESANPFTPDPVSEIRWGLFQDTDNELGSSAPYGAGWFGPPSGNGATVVWGRDDGNWFASQPGAEGDKGIYSKYEFGSLASTGNARINWEYNVLNINGTTNNGRILEGSGVNNTPGVGGDTGTIATPPGDGTGGIITDLSTYAPHKLSMEIIRQADGSLQVAEFVDNVEFLRDTIKTTDTGYAVIGPPADSFNYVAFRNSIGDYDYVIDNFKVETFSASVAGDYNGDGKVDAADYVMWRKNPAGFGGDPAGYDAWRANFGNPPGSGASLGGSAVPEPASVLLFVLNWVAVLAFNGRSAGNRAAC